jgi:hypothetical protein
MDFSQAGRLGPDQPILADRRREPEASLVAAPVRSAAPVRRHQNPMARLNHQDSQSAQSPGGAAVKSFYTRDQVVPTFVISAPGQWSITHRPQRSWRASLLREHNRCARACAYSFRHARRRGEGNRVVIAADVRMSVPSLWHGSRARWAASTRVPREWADA